MLWGVVRDQGNGGSASPWTRCYLPIPSRGCGQSYKLGVVEKVSMKTIDSSRNLTNSRPSSKARFDKSTMNLQGVAALGLWQRLLLGFILLKGGGIEATGLSSWIPYDEVPNPVVGHHWLIGREWSFEAWGCLSNIEKIEFALLESPQCVFSRLTLSFQGVEIAEELQYRMRASVAAILAWNIEAEMSRDTLRLQTWLLVRDCTLIAHVCLQVIKIEGNLRALHRKRIEVIKSSYRVRRLITFLLGSEYIQRNLPGATGSLLVSYRSLGIQRALRERR